MKLLICIAALLATAYGDRIVGGQDASISDYPWQVSLQYTGSSFCGGSLIHRQYVFTAAHCNVYAAALTKVALGTDDISTNAGQKIGVEFFTSNPNYQSPSQYSNDFAVIKLASAASLSSTVGLISLPSENVEPNRNYDVTTTGWGYVTSGITHQSTNKLQVATLDLKTDTYCRNAWGNNYDSGSMICAGGDGTASSCMGDSGGPLTQTILGNTVLVGAVSWGSGTCNTNSPGVYAQVSVARSWVSSITGGAV